MSEDLHDQAAPLKNNLELAMDEIAEVVKRRDICCVIAATDGEIAYSARKLSRDWNAIGTDGQKHWIIKSASPERISAAVKVTGILGKMLQDAAELMAQDHQKIFKAVGGTLRIEDVTTEGNQPTKQHRPPTLDKRP